MRLFKDNLGLKALKAAVLVMAVLSLGAGEAFAVPDAAHGVKGVSTKWRNHYRNIAMVSLHKLDARGLLINHSSKDTVVNGAIELFMEGKWDDAVTILKQGTAETQPPGASVGEGSPTPRGAGPDGEGLYIAGLMYEAVGFYPEALMGYAQIADGSRYREMARLRVSLMSLLNALRSDSRGNLLELDNKIEAATNGIKDVDLRNEAFALRAYVLFGLGRSREAEESFKKSGGRLEQNPFSLFLRAENRAAMGDHDGAFSTFHKIESFSESTSDVLLRTYVYLRQGDMAMMGRRYKDAESFYLKIPGELARKKPQGPGGQAQDPGYRGNDSPLIKAMALSELYMMDKKSGQAIEVLKGLLDADIPYGIGMDDNAMFYLVRLSNESANFEDTLSFAMKYNERFPQSQRKRNVMVEVERAVTMLIGEAYGKGEYAGAIRRYNDNIQAIWKQEAHVMAAESFLELGLPDDAARIFERLVKLYGPFKDIKIPLGLARAEIARGNADEATRRLKALRPASAEDDLALARAQRQLGHLYFGLQRYKDALDAFAGASRHINDPDMELKRADAFALTGQNEGAIETYKRVAARGESPEVALKAYVGMGDVYYATGRWPDALSAYGKAMADLDPSDRAFVLYRMGVISSEMGNEKAAVDSWREAAASDPAGHVARLAEERIKESALWRSMGM